MNMSGHPRNTRAVALLLSLSALVASAPCALAWPVYPQAATSLEAPTETNAAEERPIPLKPGERTFLVPPGGGAYDIPIHAGAVCVFSFFEPIAEHSITSSLLFTVESWGAYGVGVHAGPPLPIKEKPETPEELEARAQAERVARVPGTSTTLAIKTATRSVRINLTVRVVAPDEPAYTMVVFRAATEKQAFDERVRDEVEKRMVPLRKEVEATRTQLDELIRERAERMVTERALKRTEVIALNAHERNAANVVAHIKRAMLLGEYGYLFFEIENRGGSAFRLARVEVTAAGKKVPGRASLLAPTIDKDPLMIGVVQGGATARGVVIVPADMVMNKALSVGLSGPEGRGAFRLTNGLVLK
jgi:hypothetical protein